jgi:hypothetical protein
MATRSSSAGTASSGVHRRPRWAAKGANSIGAIAFPMAPPVTCTDIDVPRRAPPTRLTMAAAVGWNAALPRQPATRMAPSMVGDVARPARLMNVTATSGPATARTFGRQRSASGPNTSCAIDPAIWMRAAMLPAAASDIPSRGMNSGKSGA